MGHVRDMCHPKIVRGQPSGHPVMNKLEPPLAPTVASRSKISWRAGGARIGAYRHASCSKINWRGVGGGSSPIVTQINRSKQILTNMWGPPNHVGVLCAPLVQLCLNAQRCVLHIIDSCKRGQQIGPRTNYSIDYCPEFMQWLIKYFWVNSETGNILYELWFFFYFLILQGILHRIYTIVMYLNNKNKAINNKNNNKHIKIAIKYQ
jgi:hypothetical protein